jgi:hypothetical protein
MNAGLTPSPSARAAHEDDDHDDERLNEEVLDDAGEPEIGGAYGSGPLPIAVPGATSSRFPAVQTGFPARSPVSFFSRPPSAARRPQAAAPLSSWSPGLARRVPASEDGGRTRPHVLASDATHAGVTGIQTARAIFVARSLRPRRVGEHGRRPRATRVRRLRLHKGRASDPEAWRGPPRSEATREMKNTGSDHRRGIGQRPATEGSGMRRA